LIFIKANLRRKSLLSGGSVI